MRSWLETAQRNSPTLLILDNLDALLPPENEVRVCEMARSGES
jgi:hypothetical protein